MINVRYAALLFECHKIISGMNASPLGREARCLEEFLMGVLLVDVHFPKIRPDQFIDKQEVAR